MIGLEITLSTKTPLKEKLQTLCSMSTVTITMFDTSYMTLISKFRLMIELIGQFTLIMVMTVRTIFIGPPV